MFVGEFAANIGHHQTLQAAVAEGSFLLGFEHNGDKVIASSFAPLLRNVDGTQWDCASLSLSLSAPKPAPLVLSDLTNRCCALRLLVQTT